MARPASVRVESLTLPAYRFHEDPFPPLQRTGTRRVYPYPMQDDLTGEAEERTFTAVVLDNGLLRVTVLPELGGHVLSARDLVHDREVFYANVPLKFGLIALRGAWWAGGIEFNFPQVGHNVSSSDTVSWHVREDEEDGSATLFLGTVEQLTRMAWTVALTLSPDDWRLHVRVRLFNRTPFWHRSYFWSNAAMPARDDFRLLLPATKVYSWWYGADGDASFPINKGQDLSRYASFQRPGDAFAKDLRADWFGCYYETLDCGVVHHASRFDVPGRKLFTWGRSDDGKAWAELLNERAEPYVEIQSGRFVHQGVHRLMAPQSVEAWDEAWAPVWGLGGVVHATEEIALNATREPGCLTLRLLAFVPVEGARLAVKQDGKVLKQSKFSLGAGETRSLAVPLRGSAPVSLEFNGEKVTLLVDGEAVRAGLDAAAPHTAVPEKPSEDDPTTPHGWLLRARDHEEWSLLDKAAECCRKALGLDPLSVPAMAGIAQWHLKRSEADKASEWARKALDADLQSEDALWWSALADLLGGSDPTSHLFALQSTPRYGTSALGLLGELALRDGRAGDASRLFARALDRNPQNSRTWALAALAARKEGGLGDPADYLAECEDENPLEPLLWSERHSLHPADAKEALDTVFGSDPQTWLEPVCDYERVGDWEAALNWLQTLAIPQSDPSRRAMLLYHAAFALGQLARADEALEAARRASEQSPLFAAPHRHEDSLALQAALRLRPDDALAHLLLGNWLASVGRWAEALERWTRTTQLAETGELAAIAWRNIGLITWREQKSADAALAAYARALSSLDPRPSTLGAASWRLWLERDTVLMAQDRHAERVAAFESAPDAVTAKWQVLARWAGACLGAGRPEQALELLSRCRFIPWEGEHRSRQFWKDAHMQLGHRAREAGDLGTAQEHFLAAASYPRHLGVGRPASTDDADALFWAGSCALEAGDGDKARALLTQAAAEQQPREACSTEFKARAADLLKTMKM